MLRSRGCSSPGARRALGGKAGLLGGGGSGLTSLDLVVRSKGESAPAAVGNFCMCSRGDLGSGLKNIPGLSALSVNGYKECGKLGRNWKGNMEW